MDTFKRKHHYLMQFARLGIGGRINDAKPFWETARPVIERAEHNIKERESDSIILRLSKIGAVMKTMKLRSNEDVIKPSGPDIHVAMRNQGLECDYRTDQQHGFGTRAEIIQGQKRYQTADDESINRMRSRMHQHIHLLRQMVRRVTSPQERP